jgi:beta-glucosidase
MNRYLSLLFLLLTTNVVVSKGVVAPEIRKDTIGMYHESWIDFNKNGKKDTYEDPTKTIDERMDNLISLMTVEEKSNQLANCYGYGIIWNTPVPDESWEKEIWKDGLGLSCAHLEGNAGNWNNPDDIASKYVWPASSRAETNNKTQKFFVENTRLGIPVLLATEGIKGVIAPKTTCFGVPLNVGSTWDLNLIHKVGTIVGKETYALGYRNLWYPILDVPRDQRWGRFEEGSSESPYMASKIGVELIKGVQSQKVVCTSKHFGPYGYIRGGREGHARIDPRVTPREIEEVSDKTWRDAIKKAGLISCMISYPDYDGVPMHSHPWLKEKLVENWGMKGFMITDAAGIEHNYDKFNVAKDFKESVEQCVNAGISVWLDFRNPKEFIVALRDLVKEGEISEYTLNERVKSVLYAKFWSGLFDNPYLDKTEESDKIVNSNEHQKIELETARKSVILLKNDNNILPLDRRKISKIAVIGPVADDKTVTLKQYGPYAAEVVTVFEGIKNLVGDNIEVNYEKGCSVTGKNWPQIELYKTPLSKMESKRMDKAKTLAEESDVIVAVLGDNGSTSGESRSRSDLDLPGRQEELIRMLKAMGKPVIVVILAGRPMSINWINDHIDGVLLSFLPGTSGGQAIAESIFGDLNPGAKLNCSFPKTVGSLPMYFPYKNMWDNEGISWSSGNNGFLYHFGHGLSYTSFKYDNLKLNKQNIKQGEPIQVSFKITNTGDVKGDEIPQLYIHDVLGTVSTWEKRMCGFERITLSPGESEIVNMTIYPEDMEILDKDMNWMVEPGDFEIMVGASSNDIRLNGKYRVVK